MLKNKIQKLSYPQSRISYTPEFFRLRNQIDKLRFESLLDTSLGIMVFDELVGQVEELVKCQNPQRVFSKQELHNEAMNVLSKNPYEEYGVWVYYPWSNRVIHILDETEFIAVRTNRNTYKITKEERDSLATKRIGVIGLSVGQSVAVTLAQERGCGELRIADFDTLELSNYNRIRTGLYNLGLNKAISVAREIAEIDPFLKVVPFIDGISENNVDDFFLSGGKLDLVIDECDGLDIKVLCRNKAKAYHIPVLMEASDRGTVDVERYDLEPERPILHGFLEGLDVSIISKLKTNEERIPYLLKFAGSETLSKRAKASMIEVGQTINTWPQLASAVVFGGGLTADVSRRILLDEFHDSGRYFIDLEDLISDKKSILIENEKESIGLTLNEDAIIENDFGEVESISLSNEIIEEVIAAGISAPTIGNSQTWRWIYKNNLLYLVQSKSNIRKIDSKGDLYTIGLGAAIENVVLKSNELGFDVELVEFPLSLSPHLICVFKFINSNGSHSSSLAKVISLRATNRKITPRQVISNGILKELEEEASFIPGAKLSFVTEVKDLELIGDFVSKIEGQELLDIHCHRDFMGDIRWSEDEVFKSRNGIDVNLLELSNAQKAVYLMLKDPNVIALLNKWDKGSLCEKLSMGKVITSSAIGMLSMPKQSKLDLINGGRAFQRVWLQATMKNISLQPLASSVSYLNAPFEFKKGSVNDELHKLRKQLLNMFSLTEESSKIMLFRVFMADRPEKKSLRIPMNKILTFK